jgi:predicted ATPase/DNA-binding XRE family transcriptional regulator
LDWTQAELAQRIGYSVATVRKLERDELRPSKHLAELLAQGLDVAITDRASVVSLARSTPTAQVQPDAQPAHVHRRSNLPAQLTPFFGRTAEIVELTQHLTNPAARLITIVGPGGMGKTRLALEVARLMFDLHTPPDLTSNQASSIKHQTYSDGVYFVALAPIRAPEHIVSAIAEAINLRFQADTRLPKQQLLDYLRHKHLLLVLDNFEHLKSGAELMLEYLHECPVLRLLVTSREQLQLSSETLFVLESMALPAAATLPDVLSYSAVQLFVETARRVRPKFTPTSTNVQAIVRICQLVGGMPLGILLAAAWVEVLSCDEIVIELSQGFDFLAAELCDLPERQRSMRAVLTQSWQRLTEAERTVFMRLAVFRGGFTRVAAQQVAGASVRMLSSFVNKSLVQCEPNRRYTIHEFLRQFAEAELAAADQTGTTISLHCTYYTDFLHQRESDLKGRCQAAALDAIEADFENVRAAWQSAVDRRSFEAVGRALESLYWYCEIRCRFHEERSLLELARTGLAPIVGEAAHPIWGRVTACVVGQGFLANESQTDAMPRLEAAFALAQIESQTDAIPRLEAALALAQKHESQTDIAFCLWRLALASMQTDDLQGAAAYFEQSIVYYRSLNDRFYLGYALKQLGVLYFVLDRPDKAAVLVKQSLDVRRQTGELTGLADSVGAMGWVEYNNGRYTEAEGYWHERQQLLLNMRILRTVNGNQFEFAWLAIFNHGDLDTARALAEEVQAMMLNTNNPERKHRSLQLFGLLAGLHEDYDACYQYHQQILALNWGYFSFETSWEQIGLCLAACGLNYLPAARQHLQRVLEISLIYQWPPNAAKGLTFAAIIAAKSGKPERATELLALVLHHPLSPKGWLGQWPLITRLRAELEATLTPEGFQATWRRGATLDLLATAQEQLAELAGANSAAVVRSYRFIDLT